jgi:hypothetical protein
MWRKILAVACTMRACTCYAKQQEMAMLLLHLGLLASAIVPIVAHAACIGTL